MRTRRLHKTSDWLDGDETLEPIDQEPAYDLNLLPTVKPNSARFKISWPHKNATQWSQGTHVSTSLILKPNRSLSLQATTPVSTGGIPNVGTDETSSLSSDLPTNIPSPRPTPVDFESIGSDLLRPIEAESDEKASSVIDQFKPNDPTSGNEYQIAVLRGNASKTAQGGALYSPTPTSRQQLAALSTFPSSPATSSSPVSSNTIPDEVQYASPSQTFVTTSNAPSTTISCPDILTKIATKTTTPTPTPTPTITTTTTIRPAITPSTSTRKPNSTVANFNATSASRRPYKGPTSSTRRRQIGTSSRRPSVAPSMSEIESMANHWTEQGHTTQRPYEPKRDCGARTMRERQGRIVGGRDSQMGEFPWSVLIRETTLLGLFVKTKCGGVLIDLKWVLTAAHCQPGMFGSLVVVVGEYDLAGKSSSSFSSAPPSSHDRHKPLIRRVKRMIIHRDYNPSNFDNDIALLELETPFQVQPHIVPICLPEKDEEFIGQQALVAGWGKLSFGGPVPSVLQVAKLPVIGNKQCQEMYFDSGHMKIISDSFLCAGYANGGQDSCEGDSGGPLQVQRHDGRWVLVGTVSHGIKCAEPNLPGIYIRTAAYLPWIRAVTHHQDKNKRYGHRLLSGI